MYLEHHDTARLERAEQASAFLCDAFPHELGPDLYAKLDKFHEDVTAAIIARAADRMHRQQCPAS